MAMETRAEMQFAFSFVVVVVLDDDDGLASVATAELMGNVSAKMSDAENAAAGFDDDGDDTAKRFRPSPKRFRKSHSQEPCECRAAPSEPRPASD